MFLNKSMAKRNLHENLHDDFRGDFFPIESGPAFMFHDRNHAMPNRSFFLLPLIQLSLLFSPFRAMVAKAHHRMAQALYYMCSFSLGNFTYLYRYLVGNRKVPRNATDFVSTC